MRRCKLLLLLSFIIIVIYGCKSNQPLVNYDTAFQYHPQKTSLNYQTLAVNDSIKIIISLNNPTIFAKMNLDEFKKSFSFSYAVFPHINSKTVLLSDSLSASDLAIEKVSRTYFLTFNVPTLPNREKAVLLFHRRDIARNYIETDQIALDFTLKNSDKNFLIRHSNNNCYVLNNYISPNDSISIIPGNKELNDIHISILKQPFLPANPPHKENDSLKFNSIQVDSSFFISSTSVLSPVTEGLYIINSDSKNNIKGYSVLVKNNSYPKVKTAEELIEPLVYITNRSDFQKLTSSPDPKAALDSFWLKIGTNKDYTRSLIKSYYEKVEYTNQVFTSYKEGWKTDRGMIYIVFGKPDEVYQYDEYEEWVYAKQNTKIITFTFIKNTEQFSAVDYILKRNLNYQFYWYSAIERWRNGIITK